MSAATVPWIILFAPLVSAALILFLGKIFEKIKRRPGHRRRAAFLRVELVAVSSSPAKWVPISFSGSTSPRSSPVPIGMTIDPLSRTMLVVVNTIAPLVFIYSIGYMAHEEGYWRYFGGLALFLFSMLGIVLANNFVMMFIFWELVGLSSYILIGHYYSKASAADACKQAFIVNRIGDFGFMLGILMLWFATGSVVFGEIFAKVPLLESQGHYLTIACILVFCGTIGKSAQLPLHVWLPNSMEGPTPVSSLLHAATMVAAGVYMLARVFPLLVAAPIARDVIAWVGAITCLAAGLMATQQNDIKRILAYSTISQLGYMVLGAGVAPVPDVPMFHLFTHAFFKCLLFLCAGSVIVALHHEQDIWHMGGLKAKDSADIRVPHRRNPCSERVPGLQRVFQQRPHHRLGGGRKADPRLDRCFDGRADRFLHVPAPGCGFSWKAAKRSCRACPRIARGNGRPLDSPGHSRLGGRLRAGRKVLLPPRRTRARSPKSCTTSSWRCSLSEPASRCFFIATPRRIPSSYRFSPTGFTLTTFTTGL